MNAKRRGGFRYAKRKGAALFRKRRFPMQLIDKERETKQELQDAYKVQFETTDLRRLTEGV